MESFNSSGSIAKGSSGSVSYSIGQVIYTYIGDNTIEQGIQHGDLSQKTSEETEEENNKPEDIDSGEDLETTPAVNVLIYPNPTTDFINISTEGLVFENENNSYQLFNYQGKLLMQNSMSQDNTQINLDNLSSSMYILRVFVNNSLYRTFKILKK
ncbi:T9SS type A sorting domain-containing protein [Mariniflexile fucanivorans]|nr:T9SS type A sorting domain-containing protein [Mariniflexile fucanivorans]